MTTLLEKLFYFLAPHDCIICSKEGNIVCISCRDDLIDDSLCRCHVCGSPSGDYTACNNCRRKSALEALYVIGSHDSELRDIVHQLKFVGARQVADDMAPVFSEILPHLPEDLLITHAPTANTRARARGFDQAELLAKALSTEFKRPHASLLRRHGETRQIGADEATRREQASAMFSFVSNRKFQNRPVLLVDDVVTTGATIEAAARLFKKAGATEVYGLAIARRIG